MLKDSLPFDTTNEELERAAIKDILFLVVRDLVDVIPLLMEFDEHDPHIQLPYLGMSKIREITFLRGHIPYLTQKVASQIGKRFWFDAIKNPKSVPEIFCGNISNIKACSCDWICSELPERLHDDIYANGKSGGGRGFNRKSIFEIAEEEGIDIGSMPQHPLERKMMILPSGPPKPKPTFRNDLPELPEPLKVTGARYPMDEKFILETRESRGGILSDKTFAGVLSRIKADAREEIYCINDKPANRYQMMLYIPWAITEGKTLRDICKGVNGTPTMLEIARWLQYYPDFRRELENAEIIQAHTFVDQAQEIIMDLDDVTTSKDELAIARAKSNFLLRRAALQSEKFREKKVIQTEALDNKNEAEIKRKLKMLLRGEIVTDIIEVERIKDPEDVPEFGESDAV